MTNKSLDKLFLDLHASYLKTADFHLKKTVQTGHTFGMQLQGEWIFALPDPRESNKKISFATDWRSDWNVVHYPKWLSLTKIESQQLKIIHKYRKNLKINKILLEEIHKESRGLWVLHLKNLYDEQINQKKMIYDELAYLELLCPNIFSVAANIVSEKTFGKIKKTINSLADLDSASIENKKYYYISSISKLQQKSANSYSPVIKSRDLNWTSHMYPPSFPVSFNLTKTEVTIFVAHELFKLEILPSLQFEKMRKRSCLTCNRKFDPNKEVSWFSVVPPTICSICLNMAINTKLLAYEQYRIPKTRVKENAIVGITEFEKVFGFIPSSNFNRKNALKSLIKKNQLGSREIEIIKALAVLPRNETAKKYFGTWAHLLHAAGVLERSKTTYGGYRSISSDEHLCLSIGERLICEALTSWEISHEKEPIYPFDAELNPKMNLRADFKVKSTLIEYAGRMSNEAYAKQIAKKIALARKKSIKLIILDRVDDRVLNDLKKKLNSY